MRSVRCKIKYKAFLTALMVCTLMLSFVSGCGESYSRDVILYDGSENSAKNKTSINFFGFKADSINLIAIESAIQGFMEENPDIDITYESIKGNEYYTVLDRRDDTNSLDDVFMSKQDHILKMASEGKLADLSGLKGVDGFSDQAASQFLNPNGGGILSAHLYFNL